MKKKNLSAKKKIPSFFSKKLEDPKIKRIYLNFKKKLPKNVSNNICVAVSGGVDSIALSFLAKSYSLEKKKKIYFFIVDHKIREKSTSEAKLVRSKLKSFGINCEILTLKKMKKLSNLQSYARDNRYSMIIKKSLTKKIDFILTAHHKDDLLENFFIRLLRGSGLKGLISFSKTKSKVKFDHQIYTLRPLIDVSKKDLTYISKNTFNFYVEDTSNFDDKFLRVKIRKLIAKLENEGLTFNKFKLSLNSLSESNHAIDYYVIQNLKNNTSLIPFTKTTILKKEFFMQPDEIIFRSLSEVIQKTGKRQFYARGSKVKNLINFIKSDENFVKKTLSGCIIQKIENSVAISSENK